MRRVKTCLANLSPRFACVRMVDEYDAQMYDPAHRGGAELLRDGYESVRRKVRWNEGVVRVWDQVRFLEMGAGAEMRVLSGHPVTMRAVVDLAGLRPSDVKVEAVVGRVGAEGHLEETQVMTLAPAAEHDRSWTFTAQFVPSQTGRLGYAMRISPNHYEDPLSRPCYSLLRWG
jgi:starch phosphorylase